MTFKTVESPYSVDHTVGRLIDSLFRRGITVFARIDHASNAHLAGLELDDEQVLLFGDPRAGTVLMQADPRVGLELPLRMVVWRKDGATHVGYEEPEGLGGTYDLAGLAETLSRMGGLLAQLASEAAMVRAA
jgi:uncharacterized protein (DUF302 family)